MTYSEKYKTDGEIHTIDHPRDGTIHFTGDRLNVKNIVHISSNGKENFIHKGNTSADGIHEITRRHIEKTGQYLSDNIHSPGAIALWSKFAKTNPQYKYQLFNSKLNNYFDFLPDKIVSNNKSIWNKSSDTLNTHIKITK